MRRRTRACSPLPRTILCRRVHGQDPCEVHPDLSIHLLSRVQMLFNLANILHAITLVNNMWLAVLHTCLSAWTFFRISLCEKEILFGIGTFRIWLDLIHQQTYNRPLTLNSAGATYTLLSCSIECSPRLHQFTRYLSP